jgi:hypothetical protein
MWCYRVCLTCIEHLLEVNFLSRRSKALEMYCSPENIAPTDYAQTLKLVIFEMLGWHDRLN